MVVINLVINGDPDEVIRTIQNLAPANSPTINAPPPTPEPAPPPHHPLQPEPAPEPEPEPPPQPRPTPMSGWTSDNAQLLWSLLAPNARQMIHQIASSRNHTMSRTRLAAIMGYNKRQLGPSFSTVGRALTRIAKDRALLLPNPIILDKANDRYILREDFGQAYQRLALRP